MDTKLIKELLCIKSPTGFEDDIQAYFKAAITPYVDKITEDNLKNVYAEITGHPDMPRIMINAHCDSVGFIIKYIGDNGFLYTEDLPGHITTDYRMLPGTDVLVNSRKTGNFIEGCFVPQRPIHKLSDEDLEQSEERDELSIDIGAHSKKQALSYVNVGDYVILTPNIKFIDMSKRVTGTTLDDRLGIYSLIQIAKNISSCNIKKKPTVIFTSTVSEENFIGAAKVAAQIADIDLSLTIDAGIATDQIVSDADYCISKKYGWLALGSGVALARGFAVTDSVFLELERLCENHNIPYQIEANGGNAECELIQPAGRGVKTGLLSFPVRNLHTRIETASIQDVENLITLATYFVKYYPKTLLKK